jgi:ribosomal protein L16 Arg81 hydroxylase
MADRSDASWLTELVAPVPADEFLSNYWLKQHLYCRGARDRFAHLLSWTTLNEILNHHWRETYRFRLACQGRDLTVSSYADLDSFTPRVRTADVTEQLRRGATLSFDAIDELHDPLTRLARAFEAFFRGGTKINIYAGWRSLHGLDLHRDNQEIFILHLDGRKRWLLYGDSVDAIDRSTLSSASVPPAGAILDEVLHPGDLLYIPRGCYHVAVPMNEPALHLTLGVKNPRGIDIGLWLVERLRARAVAGQDVPFLGSVEERCRYSEEVRRALLEGLESDLVEQYFLETGSNLKPRPSFGLPWSATPEGLPPGNDFLLTLKGQPRVVVNGDDDTSVEVHEGSRQYRFPRAVGRIIQQLDRGETLAIDRLIEMLAPPLDAATVRMLVGMLARHGLVAISA